MGKTLQVTHDRAFDNDGKTVLPTEIARGYYLQNIPSLQAIKLLYLLIDKAGERMADDTRHEFRLSETKTIKDMRNHDRRSLTQLFAELSAAVLIHDDTKQQQVIIGGILDIAKIDYRDEAKTGDLIISWWFHRSFREMAAASDHWAIIDRQTAFHFRSKYSLLLFQHIASLVNLKYVTSKSFTIPELRSVLGIPKGKLGRFADLKKWALNLAITEINKTWERFDLTATPHRVGRSVETVEISWTEKSEDSKAETKREIARHSAGRKARQKGTVESVVSDFPKTGRIGFSDWASIARQELPKPAPDVDTVAEQFRGWCVYKGISLDAKTIEKTFRGFCKNYGK
jgi:hypothetical protein